MDHRDRRAERPAPLRGRARQGVHLAVASTTTGRATAGAARTSRAAACSSAPPTPTPTSPTRPAAGASGRSGSARSTSKGSGATSRQLWAEAVCRVQGRRGVAPASGTGAAGARRAGRPADRRPMGAGGHHLGQGQAGPGDDRRTPCTMPSASSSSGVPRGTRTGSRASSRPMAGSGSSFASPASVSGTTDGHRQAPVPTAEQAEAGRIANVFAMAGRRASPVSPVAGGASGDGKASKTAAVTSVTTVTSRFETFTAAASSPHAAATGMAAGTGTSAMESGDLPVTPVTLVTAAEIAGEVVTSRQW